MALAKEMYGVGLGLGSLESCYPNAKDIALNSVECN